MKRMLSKFAAKLMLGTAVLAATAGAAHARDWETIRKSGTLLAATEGAFAPFNYFQGAKLTGYEVEVAEAVAKKLGLAIEWRALGFDALVASVRQDRFDFAIASHGYTEERARSVDFADPHYCTGGQIIANAGGPKTVAQLAGKSVAVQLATTYSDNVAKLPSIKEARTFPKDTDALQALIAKRVDAWVTDRFVAKAALEKNAAANLQAGDMLFTERVSIILRKNNNELKSEINKALAALKADGTLRALSEKYFKEDISCK